MKNEKSKPLVFISVVNFNGREDTAECLKSLCFLDYSNYKVFVVDNASQDGSIEMLKKHFPSVEVIENSENEGYGKANNRVIERALEAKADYVLVLNNDTIVSPSLVTDLIREMEQDPTIGIAGPKILYHDRKDRIWFAGGKLYLALGNTRHIGMNRRDDNRFQGVIDQDYQTGCALLIRREVLEKIGGFDPRYFAYWEDVDLCHRAKRAGYRVICNRQAKMWHKVSAATGGGINAEKAYLKAREGVKFFRRNSPRFLSLTTAPIGAFAYILWSAFFGRLKGKRGILKSYIKGLADGMKSGDGGR